MAEGWIKIHRSIQQHWLWKEPIKIYWWLDILLTVNHSDAKINIGYELFDCKRGQSIMSLKNWADRWGVSKDTARNFLRLLEKDAMIVHERIGKSTRITVCNYDAYQGILHDEQAISKRKTNDEQTQTHPNKKNKEEIEGKERKEKNIYISQDDINCVYSAYPNKCPIKNSSTGKSIKDKDKIEKLLKTRTKDELLAIINNYVDDCTQHTRYMKNFKTFLNNIPDVEETPAVPEKKERMCNYWVFDKEKHAPLSEYEKDKAQYGIDVFFNKYEE